MSHGFALKCQNSCCLNAALNDYLWLRPVSGPHKPLQLSLGLQNYSVWSKGAFYTDFHHFLWSYKVWKKVFMECDSAVSQ